MATMLDDEGLKIHGSMDEETPTEDGFNDMDFNDLLSHLVSND